MEEIIKGKWWDIENKTQRVIKASYDRKDWKMDPKGYLLIKVDREMGCVRVGYCRGKEMVAEVRGTTSIEIVNTLIREEMVSTLQHAADLGIEIEKACLALKHGMEYVQDKELVLGR